GPRRQRSHGAPLQPAHFRVSARRQRRCELLRARREACVMSLDAVLFDLDGTLVDSAPDLVAVLNTLLAEDGRPPAPYAIARNEASNGAVGLLRLGFGHELPAARFAA